MSDPIEHEILDALLGGDEQDAVTLIGVMDRAEFNALYRAAHKLVELMEPAMQERLSRRQGL